MSAQEPLIIQSDNPFKVEATLSKSGGIDALGKRPPPLVKGEALTSEPGQPVASEGPLEDRFLALPADPADDDVKVSVPAQGVAGDRYQSIPSEGLSTNDTVRLPPSDEDMPGVAGPLRQDLIDTSHREQFDDPSRYLNTRFRVRIPSTAEAQSEGDVMLPDESVTARSTDLSATRDDASALSTPPHGSPGQVPVTVSEPQPGPGSMEEPPAAVQAGSMPDVALEKREAFNQRIQQIKSSHDKISKDLASLEKSPLAKP